MEDPEAIRVRAEQISHGPEAGTPLENWVRAEQEHFVAHFYDTVGHDLARLGLTIVRVPLEAGVVWRLTLPRGELVEAWEPGTNGLVPPAEIMRLVGGILDGNPLIPESAVLREPGAAQLRAALREQLEALLTHDPGVRLGVDPENLHQHRVAARRVRAFLHTTRAHVDPGWARGLTELLKELSRVTGPARDLDVLVGHASEELASVDDADRAGADRLLQTLAADRAAANARVSAALDSGDYHLLLTRLRLPPRFRTGVDDLPLERVGRKEFARLTRAVRRLGTSPDDEAIHGLRMTLKRARYAAELSAPQGKAKQRFLDAAKTLQDLLGEHQDAAVAEATLRASTVRDDPTAAAFVAGRLAERQAERRRRVAVQLAPAWRRLRRRGAKL